MSGTGEVAPPQAVRRSTKIVSRLRMAADYDRLGGQGRGGCRKLPRRELENRERALRLAMLIGATLLTMTGVASAEEVCWEEVAPGVDWCVFGEGNLQSEIHWATVDLTVPEPDTSSSQRAHAGVRAAIAIKASGRLSRY